MICGLKCLRRIELLDPRIGRVIRVNLTIKGLSLKKNTPFVYNFHSQKYSCDTAMSTGCTVFAESAIPGLFCFLLMKVPNWHPQQSAHKIDSEKKDIVSSSNTNGTYIIPK